jgi:hypothetical protein
MSASDSARSSKIRRDGWTGERQLRFLDALAQTCSVTRAAAHAGMSRESAYQLRARREGALFAAAWDRALEGPVLSQSKGHKVEGPRSRLMPKKRANPPKVTKWRKWKDSGFGALLDQLRDLPLTQPAAARSPSPGGRC